MAAGGPRRAPTLAVTLTLLASLAAGCLGGSVDPAATAEDAAPAAAADALARIALDACTQTHAFFTMPAALFADALPEGFTATPADAAGASAQFLLATSDCAGGNVTRATDGAVVTTDRVGEMWGFLFVTPPDGATDGYLADVLPLGAFATHPDALAVFTAWGFPDGLVATADVTIDPLLGAAAPGAVATSHSSAYADAEVYDVVGVVPATGAEFHDGAFRVWIPDGAGTVNGSLAYQWGTGVEVGLGTGIQAYQGDLLAQPGVQPGLLHHVTNVHVNLTRLPDA